MISCGQIFLTDFYCVLLTLFFVVLFIYNLSKVPTDYYTLLLSLWIYVSRSTQGRKRRTRLDSMDDSNMTEIVNDSKSQEVSIETEENTTNSSSDHEVQSNFEHEEQEMAIEDDWLMYTSLNKRKIKALPEVPPSPKKSHRRQRTKKNSNKAKFKPMDDSSETSSTSDSSSKNCYTPPEKTTIYSPLPGVQQSNLDMYSLYQEFNNYLLTEDQLKSNDFPEESAGNPGRIVIRNSKIAKNSSERRCARCRSTFHIHSDGTYTADSMCRYHSRKQQPYREGHPYRGDYPCCNGDYLSEGCMTCQYHVTSECALQNVEFVKTKSKKHHNKLGSFKVYGLDCEMLYTTAGMEVGKVGLVSVEGLTVFENFVLPQNQILDYNTIYSGLTEKDIKTATMTLSDVQAYLLKLLNEDSILVGHGLENDFRALRLIHRKVVDTSVVFPHERIRYKKSLKNLAVEFLSKEIQKSSDGHNCIEDSRTCMELMLLKINSDLEERPPVSQDENKNGILQNTAVPVTQHLEANTASSESWPYSSNYYCGNSYRGESFYSGLLMTKSYQRSCIY